MQLCCLDGKPVLSDRSASDVGILFSWVEKNELSCLLSYACVFTAGL